MTLKPLALEERERTEALLDLWLTLLNGAEPAEAIAFVAAAYTRRTGREPALRTWHAKVARTELC
jgi:hypothetical protein